MLTELSYQVAAQQAVIPALGAFALSSFGVDVVGWFRRTDETLRIYKLSVADFILIGPGSHSMDWLC